MTLGGERLLHWRAAREGFVAWEEAAAAPTTAEA